MIDNFELSCTVFDEKSYQENTDYRKKHNIAVIYAPTNPVREKYSPDLVLAVVEMNNSTNKIEGIGFIQNKLDRYRKIYSNPNYNFYVYSGDFWISREQIELFDSELNEIFDNILFRGKSNLKRVPNISVITPKLFVHWAYDYYDVKKRVKLLFQHYFKRNKDDNDKMKNEKI